MVNVSRHMLPECSRLLTQDVELGLATTMVLSKLHVANRSRRHVCRKLFSFYLYMVPMFVRILYGVY